MKDSQSPDPHKQTNLRYPLYREARAMAEYALANGKTVPEPVVRTIDEFNAGLSNHINVMCTLNRIHSLK